MTRIGILTGGGDVPGLNAAIRAVVKHAEIGNNFELVGIQNGWLGASEGKFIEMDRHSVQGIIDRGGTILGSSRFHPHEHSGAMEKVLKNFEEQKLEAAICIGGDGTLSATYQVHLAGFPMIGIPKTIDNDVYGTELSIGHDTAVQIATDAIDRLHTTAESHNRVAIIEVMGRDNGWIAVNAGIAGAADFIIVPEHPFDVQKLIDSIKHRHEHHSSYSIVVVAEGAHPKNNNEWTYQKDTGQELSSQASRNIMRELQHQTGYDVFLTVLGHVQRGGIPVSTDRILASRFGIHAVDAIIEKSFGTMTALRNTKIEMVPLGEISGKKNAVPEHLIQVADKLA